MTVETTTRKQSFAGGQSELDFNFRALVTAPEDIKVVTLSGSTETLLTYDTQYGVTISTTGIGGTVVVSPSFSTAYTYTVYRDTVDKQESDYDDYNSFPADTIETDLDRRTLVTQEMTEELGRSVKVPISSSITELELPTPVSGKLIGWNTAADGLENKQSSVTSMGDTNMLFLSNYASFAAAIAAIAANENTLVIDTDADVDVNTTVPKTCVLSVVKKGVFSIDAGVTLTINSPLMAGRFQIFSGDGSVVFGSGAIEYAYPEWWKENTTPGTTDMTAAIQAAVTAGNVYFHGRNYLLTSSISIPDSRTIQGAGYGSAISFQGCDGFNIGGSANVTIQDIALYESGHANLYRGIYTEGNYPSDYNYKVHINRILFNGWDIAIHFIDVWDSFIDSNNTTDVNFSIELQGLCARVNITNNMTSDTGGGAVTAGIKMVSDAGTRPEGITITDNHFFGGQYGIYTTSAGNEQVHISQNAFDVLKTCIYTTTPIHWSITDNMYLHAVTGPVIEFEDIGSVEPSYSIISGNAVWCSGTGAGIYIGQNNRHISIVNNSIRGVNTGVAIWLYYYAKYILIADNNFYDSATRTPTIYIYDYCENIGVYNNRGARVIYNLANSANIEMANNTYQQKIIMLNAVPAVGTWNVGDVIFKEFSPNGLTARGSALGDHLGWVCTDSGTFGSLSVTANTSGGTETLLSVSDVTNIKPGMYVTVSAGFNSATTRRQVVNVSSSTVTLDTTATSNQTGVTVADVDPVFSQFGQSGYRSGTASPSDGSITPKFIGEEYLDSSAGVWYKAAAATLGDWKALN